MNNHTNAFNELRKIDLVAFLYNQGYHPSKVANGNYWYKSPLRKEHTASFKVTKGKNNVSLFYDFGTGEKGSVIDFLLSFYKTDIKGIILLFNSGGLNNICNNFQCPDIKIQTPKQSPLIIEQIKELQHPALIKYLKRRGIEMKIAQAFCKEIQYSIGNKKYFAIGFPHTNCNGWELRNPYFKGSSSPKDITYIDNKTNSIVVFEGFMDFLTYKTLQAQANSIIRDAPKESDYLILNSASLLERARSIIELAISVNVFFDNDKTGKDALLKVKDMNSNAIDTGSWYDGFKDLNEWLISQQGILKKENLKPIKSRNPVGER